MNNSLSLIIPVYNEAGRLEKTFAALLEYIGANLFYSIEIIFVNDGSTDNTLTLLRRFGCRVPARIVSYPDNRGKGHAIRTGMRVATGEYSIFLDADMSTDLSMIVRFQKAMQQNEMVIIGTRKTHGSEIRKHQPWWRETLGRGYTFLARIILNLSVTDFTCGFKCFHRVAREAIFQRAFINGWSYDAEILYLADRLGFRIFEVPVVWTNDKRSTVRIYRDIFQSFNDLLVIRFRHPFTAHKKSIN